VSPAVAGRRGKPSIRAVAGGALIVVASSVVAWSLAYPNNLLSSTLTRAVADCAAVVTLGVAAVPILDAGRHRGEMTRVVTTPLVVSGVVWFVAELVRLLVTAAQAVALPIAQVGVQTFTDFALHTAAGRSGLFAAGAAAAASLVAAAVPRTTPAVVATSGIAAAGLAARTLAGHLSENPLGGAAVAVHALAAAVWCGTLAALALTVEHRGQWARLLPRFSQLSLVCVVALLCAGTAGALLMLDSPAQLYSTGYGRVLAAKIVVTAALTALGWRNRVSWLPAARGHRATADFSRTRSLTELAVMTVALTLAAGLAVTG
jgi:copper resistance protein D